jgi:uncharacterized protein
VYAEAIAQLGRNLHAIDRWLDKAQAFATAKKFDVQVLLDSRLAPDQGGFVYQVQSACDYIKGGAAWLSGQTPPRHEDNEHMIDEVRERIRKTVAFVESVNAAQYAGAAARTVTVSWSPKSTVIDGENYLLQVVVPNAYFHIAMAYAILRHNGVDVGKMDFLGPIDWKR